MSSFLFLAFPLSLPLPLSLFLAHILVKMFLEDEHENATPALRGSGPLQHLCPLGALKQGVYILFLLFSFLVFSSLFSSLLFSSFFNFYSQHYHVDYVMSDWIN